MRCGWWLVLLLSLSVRQVAAQKPVIDTTVFGQWPEVANLVFSPDGRYFAYTLQYRVSGGGKPVRQTWLLQAAGGPWKREFEGLAPGVFTARSVRVRFPHDSLCLVPLGEAGLTCLPQIRSFTLLSRPTGEWLVYQPLTPAPSVGIRHLPTGRDTVYAGVTAATLNPAGTMWVLADTSVRTLTLRAVETGRRRTYAGVARYWFSPDSATLVLLTQPARSAPEAAGPAELLWVDVASGEARSIWTDRDTPAAHVARPTFDRTNTRLAFLVTDPDRQPAGHAIWYYEAGMPQAARVVGDQSVGLADGWHLDGAWQFSHDGRRLRVTVAPSAPPRQPSPNPASAPVTIWSYTDVKWPYGANTSRTGILDLQDRRFRLLTKEQESLGWVSNASGEFAWVQQWEEDEYWRWYRAPLAFVSTTTGARTPFGFLEGDGGSPGGRYRLWRDSSFNIYGTDVTMGVTRNVMRGVSAPVLDIDEGRDGGRFLRLQLVAWLENEQAVLLYDRYELWQVDPADHLPPVNLTNGYGRRHRLVFRLLGTAQEWLSTPLVPRGPLIVTAFDLTTKQSGFYRLTWGRAGDPERLSVGPYRYEETSRYPVGNGSAAKYVVRRESATESPNYFTTTDFQTFAPLTAVYPERAYRWLRAELTAWTTREGRCPQGIVYTPEDFDPRRKYPVILLHHEKLSDELYHYQRPEPMVGPGNVPWLVSRGYIVVLPDVVNTLGWPGRSAYYARELAAAHLAHLPWVDAAHIGLQGHSFGGYQTNYVVTRTGRFAAAVSAAGWVDLVDYYNRAEGGRTTSREARAGSTRRCGSGPIFTSRTPPFSVPIT